MPEALKLQQGATRTLSFTLGAGINGDWTGSTLTTTLNYRLKNGSVGAEVWRAEIAGGAIVDGWVGDATILASESAAQSVGAYWLTLALAVPGDAEDSVWKWDEYPVVLEFAAPTSVAAAGTGSPSNAGGFTTPIKLGSVGTSTSIKIGGPSISVATYTLADGQMIPIASVEGLPSSLSTITSNVSVNSSNISTLSSRVSVNSSNIAVLSGGVSTLSSSSSVNSSSIAVLSGSVSTNSSNIATLSSSVSTLSAAGEPVNALGALSNGAAIALDVATYAVTTASVAGGNSHTITTSGWPSGRAESHALDLTLTGTGTVSLTITGTLIGTMPSLSAPGVALLTFEDAGAGIRYYGARSA